MVTINMALWVGLFVGFMFGWVAHAVIARVVPKYDGIILIDDTDEQKTQWHLNVKTDPEAIPKKKSIRLQVHVQK